MRMALQINAEHMRCDHGDSELQYSVADILRWR